MKIGNNKFRCDWDGTEFTQVIKKCDGAGNKGSGSDQAVCPKCGMFISQKEISEYK